MIRQDPVRWLGAALAPTRSGTDPDFELMPVIREVVADRVAITEVELLGVHDLRETAHPGPKFQTGASNGSRLWAGSPRCRPSPA